MSAMPEPLGRGDDAELRHAADRARPRRRRARVGRRRPRVPRLRRRHRGVARSATRTRRSSRRCRRRSARLAHTSNLVDARAGRRARRAAGRAARRCRPGSSSPTAAPRPTSARSSWRRKHRPGNGDRRRATAASTAARSARCRSPATPPSATPFEPLPGPVTLRRLRRRRRAARGGRPTRPPRSSSSRRSARAASCRRRPASWPRVREICDAAGALLVVDEVQSGIGRTGHWFASQAEGVRPDVITLAKGLGGGLPIGACLGVGAAGELFAPGDHGSTFGGNPVSCAAALAVLDTIERRRTCSTTSSASASTSPTAWTRIDSPLVPGTRGTGLWRALVLTDDKAAAVEAAARDRGLLVNAVKPGRDPARAAADPHRGRRRRGAARCSPPRVAEASP